MEPNESLFGDDKKELRAKLRSMGIPVRETPDDDIPVADPYTHKKYVQSSGLSQKEFEDIKNGEGESLNKPEYFELREKLRRRGFNIKEPEPEDNNLLSAVERLGKVKGAEIALPLTKLGERIAPETVAPYSKKLEDVIQSPPTTYEKNKGIDLVAASNKSFIPYTHEDSDVLLNEASKKIGLSPDNPYLQTAQGVVGPIVDMAHGLATPTNAALLIGTAGEGLAGKLAASTFLPSAVEGGIQGAEKAYKGYQEGNLKEGISGATEAAIQGYFGKKMAEHVASGKAPIVEKEGVAVPVQEEVVPAPQENVVPVEPQVNPFEVAKEVNVQAPEVINEKVNPFKSTPKKLKNNANENLHGIDDTGKLELLALKNEIEQSQAGNRIFKEGDTSGSSYEVSANPSTFPIQMPDGLNNKEIQLRTIDKVLNNKKLGNAEQETFRLMKDHLENQRREYSNFQERNPVPMATGDLNLKVGDQVKVKGDTLKVIESNDNKLVLKDGVTRELDPVFDKIDVVGGEDGIKRANPFKSAIEPKQYDNPFKSKAKEPIAVLENKNIQEPELGNLNPNEKVAKLAQDAETKAIEKGLTEGYPEKAKFESKTFKGEAEKTAQLGLDELRSIARGEKETDVRSSAIISALERHAKMHPEKAGEIMQEIANSKLASNVSEGASETSFARMIEKGSAADVLRKVKKDLVEKAGGEEFQSKKRKELKAETKKNNLSLDDLSWDKFLNSIKC